MDRIEMKGIWKSLQGTLVSQSEKDVYPPNVSAFDLLSWALKHHQVPTDTCIHVAARIGLEVMLRKHGICLKYVEKRIPKAQGASVLAFFVWNQ